MNPINHHILPINGKPEEQNEWLLTPIQYQKEAYNHYRKHQDYLPRVRKVLTLLHQGDGFKQNPTIIEALRLAATFHEIFVHNAIDKGQPVPPEILKKYNLVTDYWEKNKHLLNGKPNQVEINKNIESLVLSNISNGKTPSSAELELIKQYEGSGGLARKGAKGEGLLHEFYTPQYICDYMWELAYHYGYEGGSVLEPSCGTGRFIQGAPDKNNVVAFEINPIAARIAELTNEEKPTIYKMHFETAFLEYPRFNNRIPEHQTWIKEYPFSLVIGNPPYGKNINFYSSYFKKPKIPQAEIFFMYYAMQLLKKGGLLVFITASNFMRNGSSYTPSKQKLEEIAEFVTSVRLPKVFKNTTIPSDILIFKRK